MPFTCGYCPTLSPDFKETISHLITDHHDREIITERMLRTLNFKIVPEMCCEQGREISINDSMETIHVSKPNKVSKESPFKKLIKTAGGASQDTNHGLIGGISRTKMM